MVCDERARCGQFRFCLSARAKDKSVGGVERALCHVRKRYRQFLIFAECARYARAGGLSTSFFKERALTTGYKFVFICARSAQATAQAAARALITGHSTCRSARANHRPQHWPQRAPSSQATELAAARALSTSHSRSARQHLTQTIALAPARALSTGQTIFKYSTYEYRVQC